MAEKYEPDEWEAVVCNGFTAVNVLSSSNVEELGWDYTEMELDPTGTCGLFEGMLLDWDDDTPDERREHEEYFPDAFTVGARILVDDWDHELSNDEVRSRCFLIIEHADQFTDHDTGRDWLCESTLADFSEVEAMTFFQNLTLMEPQDIAELGGRPIIPSAGPEECRAAVLAFNQKMIARRRERELGDTADPSKVKKTAPAPKSAAPKREQAIRGLGRVDFSGLGYGWGMQYYPDSLSVDAIGIDYQSGERNAILNFSPITHAIDLDGRKFFCHETTMGYDRNADSWSGATIGPDFWTFDGEASRRSRQGRERGGEPKCRFACGRGRRHQALGRRCLPANGSSLRDRLGGCRLCRRPPISLPRPRGWREMPSRGRRRHSCGPTRPSPGPASAYLASARRLAPYRSMYFAAFAVWSGVR